MFEKHDTLQATRSLLNVITVILVSVAALPHIALAASASDKSTRQVAGDAQVAPLSPEQERMKAIMAIDEFGNLMQTKDPDYFRKEKRILYVLPLLSSGYPPAQWEQYIRFLYLALSEIDKKSVSDEPDAILSKYYLEEEGLVPSNVFSKSINERSSLFDRRQDELGRLLDSSRIDLTEHTARTLAAAIAYFPNDKRLIGLRRYKLGLVMQLNRGEIGKEQFESMWGIKRREYNENSANIQSQNIQQRLTAEAQQKSESAQLWGNLLGGAAKGLQNSIGSQRAPITCTTIANITTCH